MSALAVMLKNQGNLVGGIDEREGAATKILQENGILVDFEFDEANIEAADVIVCSSAIKEDNNWLIFAKQKNKKIISRGQLLGEVSKNFKNVIAVSGSHGKTTTTALIFHILKQAGKNPTLHLGGYKIDDGKNFDIGGQEFFVTEACEYCDNFLHLHPTVSVITNIEKEHMDYFKTFENQLHSFAVFKSQSELCFDDLGGLSAKNIRHNKNGELSFSIYEGKRKIMRAKLKLCEEVNTQNCLYAYRVCKHFGISDDVIKRAFGSFLGVKSRFEKVKCPHFETVICDYAHHPTELAKAIETAKHIFADKKLIVIFQPHTYSRTKTLFKDFFALFEVVENLVLFKTYSAREHPKDGMSAKQLFQKLKKNEQNVQYFENFETLKDFLMTFDSKGTVLLFLGAGDLPEILNKNCFIS